MQHHATSSSITREDFENAVFVYFDLETTGRSAQWHRICQVCAVIYHKGKRKREYTTLVNPGCKIPKQATAVHGISNEDVRHSPTWGAAGCAFLSTIQTVCDGTDLTNSNNVIFVAYNGDFDLRFLHAANQRFKLGTVCGYKMWLYDPLKTARVVFPTVKGGGRGQHTLGTVYQRLFNKPIVNAHDAQADVEAMIEVCAHSGFVTANHRHNFASVSRRPQFEDLLLPLSTQSLQLQQTQSLQQVRPKTPQKIAQKLPQKTTQKTPQKSPEKPPEKPPEKTPQKKWKPTKLNSMEQWCEQCGVVYCKYFSHTCG